ncbi:MAG: hypothetical protein ACFFAX_07920 [Promethearchaeota archaeon]
MMLWFMSPASICTSSAAETMDCIQNHIADKSVAARIEFTGRFVMAFRTASWIQPIQHFNDGLDSSRDSELSDVSPAIWLVQAVGGTEEVILHSHFPRGIQSC